MKTILQSVSICLLQLVTASHAADDDPIFSGPQPGEKLPPLKIRDVLAKEVTDVDLLKKAGDKPVMIIFFHKRTRPAFGLTNALMRAARTLEQVRLTSAVVMLTDDPTETTNWMKRIRGLLPEDTLYGISMDGLEGPGAYGLNREVELTVLIAKEGKVTANFALVQPSLKTDGMKIVVALVNATGGGEVPDIVALSQNRMARRNMRPGQQKPLPGELASMLRRLINKQASEDDVDQAAKDIEEFIAEKDNAEWQQRVGQITTNIISAGKLENYGTPPAQEYLKAWAEKYGPKERPKLPADRGSSKDAAKKDTE